MMTRFNQFLDILSEYFAARKGLLPLLGVFLVIVNLILQFIPNLDFLTNSDIILHIGIIIAIIGILLAWAL
jgi:hypothetical protein